jgi:hypothetical protein
MNPIHSSKIGRNDPCPCGSGKKYKQCHGRWFILYKNLVTYIWLVL